MKSVTLQIQGMTCGHCVRAVKQALEGVNGVQSATVELGKAVVSASESVAPDALAQAVRDEGYEAAVTG